MICYNDLVKYVLPRHAQYVVRSAGRQTRCALCACLTACLTSLVFGGAAHTGGAAGVYSGASMLFESAGAYVLVALLAFMAGVAITVVLKRQQRKESKDRKTDENKAQISVFHSVREKGCRK